LQAGNFDLTGPRPKPDHLKLLDGTFRRDRSHPLVVAPLPGEPVKPAWLKGRAAKIWLEKTAVYRRRGQSVAGCEAALAQYCSLEAAMIELYRQKQRPTATDVNTYRTLAREFYDTPASQISKATGAPVPNANPFLVRGQQADAGD
jgi:hypothetical protein